MLSGIKSFFIRPRIIRRVHLILAGQIPSVRDWPCYGRMVEVIRSEGTKYEVNEFGQWSTIGRQGSEMESARRHVVDLAAKLADAERIAGLIRADLVAIEAAFPGVRPRAAGAVPVPV